MNVAIVHDYLTQRGGAERVVLAMSDAFPDAPIFTSFYEPETTYPEFRSRDIRVSALNSIRPLRHDHRRALPFLPAIFGSMSIDADVTFASSSGWAHGAHVTGTKIVYCYNPPRWLYQRNEYLGEGRTSLKLALSAISPLLQHWDRAAAASADRYFAISTVVRQRVWEAYGIDAELLPPPHFSDTSAHVRSVKGISPGYFLVVSRLMAYKNVHRVVEAFRLLPQQRLVIVGSGPMLAEIQEVASKNVRILGSVEDAELRWLYRHAAALVSASFEDFGLTPLEANAFGRPAVLLRSGGFLDTGREGTTCVFFDKPDPSSIAEAISKAARTEWRHEDLVRNAERYNRESFKERLRALAAAAQR